MLCFTIYSSFSITLSHGLLIKEALVPLVIRILRPDKSCVRNTDLYIFKTNLFNYNKLSPRGWL